MTDLHRLAARVFDEPLVIEPQKLRTVIKVLESRARPSAGAIDGLSRRRERERLAVQDGIAIIDAIGILVHRHHGLNALSGLTSYEAIASELDQALASPQVRGILLRIDSPGGEVSGVSDLADRIRAASQVKPVWAVAEDRALSGAYWLASAAERLYVTQGGFTGSVGVVMAHVDQSKFDERQGIKVTEIYAGARKADGSPHHPLDDEAHAEYQRIVDDIYALFVSHVSRNRSLEERHVRATEARIYVGAAGLEYGLADQVGSLSAAFVALRAQLGSGSTTPTGHGNGGGEKVKDRELNEKQLAERAVALHGGTVPDDDDQGTEPAAKRAVELLTGAHRQSQVRSPLKQLRELERVAAETQRGQGREPLSAGEEDLVDRAVALYRREHRIED